MTGGAAYIYDINNATQTIEFVQEVSKDSSVQGDNFGFSVAISGDYAIVGAPGYSDGETLSIGAVYIFQKDSNDWDLFSPTPRQNSFFGWSVAVNSNGVIAVGAPGDRALKGSVYIFKPNGSKWKHVYTIEPDVSYPGQAGYDVAIDDK